MLVPWLLLAPLSATPVAASADDAPLLPTATATESPTSTPTALDREGPRVRVSGMVEQVQRLPAPQDGMLAVFIRDPVNGLLVAIVPESWAEHVVVNKTVDFAARPAGSQTYKDRAGLSRTVPRVKAVEPPVATTSGVGDLTLLLGVLILLMVCFGLVSVVVARSRRRSRPFVEFDDDDASLDDLVAADALPDDPAEALSELARRSAAPSK